MDAFGDALPTGAVQEIRAHAPRASRWDSGMDQPPSLQRCRRGNEQQDQVHQPSLIWVPHREELHCSHLSLLRSAAAANRTLITLLGEEPFYLSFILPIGAIGTSYCKDLGGLPWPGIEPVKSRRFYRSQVRTSHRRFSSEVPAGACFYRLRADEGSAPLRNDDTVAAERI